MSRDYKKEFKGHCLTCKNYDIYTKSDATVRGFRCVHHHRPMAMDEKCSSYGNDITRSNQTIEDAVKWIGKRGYDPRPDKGSCYITSICCRVLGLPDDCEYLTNLRRLRDEYMVNFDEGLTHLYKYDIFGRQISEIIESEFENPKTKIKTERMVKEILEPQYLVILNELIKCGNFACAMEAYLQMTDLLMQRYSIYEMPLEVDVSTLDKQEVGHGRIRTINDN